MGVRILWFLPYAAMYYVVSTYLNIFYLPHDIANLVRLVLVMSLVVQLIIWLFAPRIISIMSVVVLCQLAVGFVGDQAIDASFETVKFLAIALIPHAVLVLALFGTLRLFQLMKSGRQGD